MQQFKPIRPVIPSWSALAVWLCIATLCLPASLAARQTSDTVAPQTTHTLKPQTLVSAKQFMVSTAHPDATQAGYAILKAGGSAVDAAVAVQLVLGLVEPQASGLGGGALMVLWDADKQQLVALDGRETAPQAVTPNLFLDELREPLNFMDAVVGGRSVGTPGTVALLAHAHAHYGKLPWQDLFTAARQLAMDGFVVTAHMAEQIADSADNLRTFPATQQYFFTPSGKPLPAGFVRKNPEYAKTLDVIAKQGAKGFYQGEIAQAIVDTVSKAATNPGKLALQDLADYQVKAREVLCVDYRQHEVCGMGPPTSGTVAIGQILGMLSHFDLKKLGADNPQSWRLIGDATRLAFADRGRYLADSDFVDVPVQALLAPAYLKTRAQALHGEKALDTVAPGDPLPKVSQQWADDAALELPSTSHFVIVDAKGNVVSLTSTIENGFGSRLMTNGFLLNNELTDFSFKAAEDGVPVANRVEAGKRPRSSMSPTIVLKDGKPYMALGSPGGPRIISYVANALIAQLDWGYDIQQAFSMPHRVILFGRYELEAGTSATAMQPALEALGYEVTTSTMTSGLSGVVITPQGLQGGADLRRDGKVLGD
ncbi:MAG: gamma-glutamyltransferase [Candidatus Thiothrix moscowensis]|nr:gamma-glutamyltransferase [Candidatus Thiothrix moscowensis]